MLTRTELLAYLQWGQEYSATQLAHLLQVPRSAAAGMLRELSDEGLLRIIRKSARVVHFTPERPNPRPRAKRDPRPASTPTSVATFPITRTLEGCLSGYDSELTRQRRLALLARDRCR